MPKESASVKWLLAFSVYIHLQEKKMYNPKSSNEMITVRHIYKIRMVVVIAIGIYIHNQKLNVPSSL